LFKLIPDQSRTKELVFLGRLVSVKGVDLLLKALKSLKERGLIPQLTIIGSGSEEDQLKQQVKDFELTSQVTFMGAKVGDELVRILNQHQIMVVPTLEPEPFGVVALEGIACGCVIVGSEGGGLKDAIADCGMTFPNGNVERLTECLFDLLTHPEKLSIYRNNAPSHLPRHTSEAVAKAYLKVLEEAIK
jgi:glycosyltransferase involved in cell wall biosynthesis